MVYRYGKWVFLILICLGLTVSGCAPGRKGPATPPAGVQAEYDDTKRLFEQAGAMGAEECAPRDYAYAQVWLEYVEHEVGERHWDEVAMAIAKAKQASMDAINKCTTPPPPEAEAPRPTFAFAPVYFDAAKADIRSDAIVVLDRIGTILQEHPWMKTEVAGHSDSGGSEEANMELSLKRSKSVSTYLIDHFAISPHRLKVIGYGESRPVADNETREGRRMNRRVEFRVME
jgi:outer membrane protein OmpA-like peptidoglycan-associated protein